MLRENVDGSVQTKKQKKKDGKDTVVPSEKNPPVICLIPRLVPAKCINVFRITLLEGPSGIGP